MRDVPVVAGCAWDRDAQLPAILCEGRGKARAVHGAQGPAEDACHDLSEVGDVGETVAPTNDKGATNVKRTDLRNLRKRS